jgi:hypothetical protein
VGDLIKGQILKIDPVFFFFLYCFTLHFSFLGVRLGTCWAFLVKFPKTFFFFPQFLTFFKTQNISQNLQNSPITTSISFCNFRRPFSSLGHQK